MRSFPLMIFAVLAYNIVAFGGSIFAGTPSGMANLLGAGHPVPLFSGDVWSFTVGDTIVTFGLLLLFVETLKATRITRIEPVNHAFSLLVFIGALVEFLVLHNFGTSVFFLLVLMCLFDVIAGYAIASVAARREPGLTTEPPTASQA